jgi:hypothetical protein
MPQGNFLCFIVVEFARETVSIALFWDHFVNKEAMRGEACLFLSRFFFAGLVVYAA